MYKAWAAGVGAASLNDDLMMWFYDVWWWFNDVDDDDDYDAGDDDICSTFNIYNDADDNDADDDDRDVIICDTCVIYKAWAAGVVLRYKFMMI